MGQKPIKYVLLEDVFFISLDFEKTIRTLFPNFRLIAAVDGLEEMKAILHQTTEFSFVIADIDSNPTGFIRLMEQEAIKMPVILISAFPEYELYACKLNVVCFILKPVATEKLRDALTKFVPSITVP